MALEIEMQSMIVALAASASQLVHCICILDLVVTLSLVGYSWCLGMYGQIYSYVLGLASVDCCGLLC